jgi:hypothetical protein
LPAIIIDGILYASWMFIIAVGLTLRRNTQLQLAVRPEKQNPARFPGRIAKPSALALLRLTTRSNFVGCSITGALRKWHTGLRPGSLRAAVREP